MQDAYGLLISPIVIAFLIGMAATLVRSELERGIFARILQGVIGVRLGRAWGLGIYLTSSRSITFPFNLILGLPIDCGFASRLSSRT